MRSGDELHPALRDRARGVRLELGTYLVDDDYLRHMVLHGLYHHRVLPIRRLHLHPPRLADAGMWNIAVPCDLVRCVDDYDPLCGIVRKHPRHVPKHRRLPNARLPQKQDALARENDILDDPNGAVNCAAHPHSQANDPPSAVSDRGNAVKRPLDPGTVVLTKRTDVVGNVPNVRTVNLLTTQDYALIGESPLRGPTKIENYFQELVFVLSIYERLGDTRRQLVDNHLQIGFNPLTHLAYVRTSVSNEPCFGLARMNIHWQFPAGPLPMLRQIDCRLEAHQANRTRPLRNLHRTGDRPHHSSVSPDLPETSPPHQRLKSNL